MKFTDKARWKIVIVAMLCVIALLAAAGGSLAIYTSQDHQRGVARNTEDEKIRFTSNYLQSCAIDAAETAYAGRTISSFANTGGMISIDIYIYNYANGNTNLVSQKDISYTMALTLSGIDSSNTYGVKYGDGDAANMDAGSPKSDAAKKTSTYTIENRKLVGRSPATHKYTITMPSSDLDKVRIIATATPTNSSTTNYQKLAAVIAPITGETINNFSFDGKFIYASGSQPSEYSGFNYEVSISSGEATATLTWNAGLLEIDPFFLQKINGQPTGTDTEKTLTFTMNQQNGTGDYLISFYIKNKDEMEKKDWPEMKTLVTFNAVQSQSTTAE